MQTIRKLIFFLCGICTLWATSAYATKLVIPMYLATEQGAGKFIGNITAQDTTHGLLLSPDLTELSPGVHGFHVHQMASCGNMAMAAGGHLDPKKTNKHLGPYSDLGHLGDLPALTVDKEGHATLPVLAPRLKAKQLEGHTLMIHAGGDNYSDVPAKLGGGGARVACGVVKLAAESQLKPSKF
jgi:Cu-Zn family superoxide dismutase